MSFDEAVNAKAKKNHIKKATKARYFDANVKQEEHDLQPIKLRRKSHQNFNGEIIKVEQHQVKRLPKALQLKRGKRPFGKNAPGKFGRTLNQKQKQKIPKETLEKYSRGEQVESAGVKTNHFKEKEKRKEVYHEYATEQTARTEILLQEESGFIIPDDGEITSSYRQEEIVKNVDIQSAAKYFKLTLDFGPYTMRFTKNGRHLLLGGRRGHVATLDWITKALHSEFNVMEEVVDIEWLHVPTMFAAAQKNWVHIYDSKGTELHCVKRLYRVNRLDFLPYHFLLAAGNRDGYATWLDVSIGELVGNFNTGLGDIRLMRHNPANGVLCIGGGKGVVSMWSPKVREPLAKLLCHSTSMTAMTIDAKGHLVTAGLDRRIKVWDVRALSGPLAEYNLRMAAHQVEVSQRGVLAFAQGNTIEMYTNLMIGKESKMPYLRQRCDGFVQNMRFCPYEDVLGIATARGYQSILVPGAGEPNYDAMEDNPYQTRKQRREHEVHALLEKIPPELITLDPQEITGVDVPTLQEKVDAKRSVFFLKPPQIDMKTRRKMKGKGGSAKASRNKQIVKDQKRKEFIANVRETKRKIIEETNATGDFIPLETTKTAQPPSVLDRFRPKIKKQKSK